MKINLLLPVIFIFLMASCKNHPTSSEESPIPKHEFTKNEILQVNIDSLQSYALYLPENYSFENSLPIIFFFDPHARGELPVNIYKDLANTYNFILVGSNNSQNGLQQAFYDQNINSLLKDVTQKINFNKDKIILCGFSGGARVAGAYAQKNQSVKAVISCSASIIGNQVGIKSFPFYYIGFVGYEDFNFIEMTNEFERLNNHKLIRYIGEHDWANPEIMEEAFVILNLFLSESNKKENVKLTIDFYTNKMNKLDDNIYDQFLFFKRASEVLQNYNPVNEFEKKLRQISKHPELQEYITYINNLKGVELDKRHKYAMAFQAEDLNWWKREMKIIDEHIAFTEFGEDKLMYIRLKNYFGMIGYFFTNRALQMNELDVMWSYLQKYEVVDPDNPDVYYYKAIYYALKNKFAETLQSIKKSIDLGFVEIEKFKTESYFNNLQNNPDFLEIMK